MGRCEGLSDAQWQVMEPLYAPWRRICNTILWILITGSRWCDVPVGAQWGSRAGAHRWARSMAN